MSSQPSLSPMSACGRADLLRMLAAPNILNDYVAAAIGFAPEQKASPQSLRDEKQAQEAKQQGDDGDGDGQAATGAGGDVGELTQRLLFMTPVRMTPLAPPPPLAEITPLSDAELAVDWSQKPLPPAPLAPAARLAPWLKRGLGVMQPGRALDLRRLLERISSGQPLLRLPRRRHLVWASQATLLLDDGEEMEQFYGDKAFVLQLLHRLRGDQGLQLLRADGPAQAAAALQELPPQAPLLALSTLAQYGGDVRQLQRWRLLARSLRQRGHRLQTLSPCPQPFWRGDVAAVVAALWGCVVWDRGAKLPRRGGPAPLRGGGFDEDGGGGDLLREAAISAARAEAERLLDRLAPAARIRPALLRRVRLDQAGASVAAEWMAWRHDDCWRGGQCCGFLPDDSERRSWAQRLHRWRQWAQRAPQQAAAVAKLIDAGHEECSAAISRECALRATLLQPAAQLAQLAELKQWLQRALALLRLQAQQDDREDIAASGVAEWWVQWFEGRLSPSLRADSEVADLLAQGYALAQSCLRKQQIDWPAGAARQAGGGELRRLGARRPPQDYRLELGADGLRIIGAASRDDGGRTPSALLRAAARDFLQIEQGAAATSLRSLKLPSSPAQPLLLSQAPAALSITSSQQRLDYRLQQRPPWAEKMASDRYGLFVVVRLLGAEFILRWIPPGRFIQGSPPDEAGRFDDEMQHEVSISQGYWLGETPVTQVQWAAVMGDNPSRFKGEQRPVENVTFFDGEKLLARLNEASRRMGLFFDFPTEAQWEYACRAGKQTAFNNGAACTEPEGADLALEALGWYSQNSGGETHEVKQKQANDWGLYDMHGNVREWCKDVWGDYTAEAQLDPLRTSTDKNAGRVVRGGSGFNQARFCRAAYRNPIEPARRWNSQGLRLAAGQPPEAADREAAEPPGAERQNLQFAGKVGGEGSDDGQRGV